MNNQSMSTEYGKRLVIGFLDTFVNSLATLWSNLLLEYKRNPMMFLAIILENGYEITRISSMTDAEGWTGIYNNGGCPLPILSISNTNRQLLECTQKTIGGRVYRSDAAYQLELYGEEAVKILRILHIAHDEKVAAKEIILRHHYNGGIGMPALWEYQAPRRKVDEEVRLCKLQARLE